jgi:hypothetical protein
MATGIVGQIGTHPENSPQGVYIQGQNGARELFSGSHLRQIP